MNPGVCRNAPRSSPPCKILLAGLLPLVPCASNHFHLQLLAFFRAIDNLQNTYKI